MVDVHWIGTYKNEKALEKGRNIEKNIKMTLKHVALYYFM